jgi:AGZA family xanthine/uracil permease-like MFS transporter
VIAAVPPALKDSIGVGIGLLIALIGLEWSGVVVAAPGTLVSIGRLSSPPTVLALATMAVMAVLIARGVKGAMLLGMIASTVAGLAIGVVTFQGVVAAPPSLAPTFLKLDVISVFRPGLVDIVFVFFLLALFDSIGTLIGVSERAGLMRDGRLPRVRQALLADAVGTVAGALLGTSTVTAYVESAAGVSAGGRTGLASVVTAGLFLLSLFFYPLVKMIGGGYPVAGGLLYPVVAPALVLVGVMMMDGVRRVRWEDPTDAIPAFLTLVTMPLAVSITDGLAFGFIAIAILKLATGRARELSALGYVFAALFLVRYILK